MRKGRHRPAAHSPESFSRRWNFGVFERIEWPPGRGSDETSVRSSPHSESQPKLHQMRKLLIYLSTLLRLGVGNVLRVLIYRACKRAGIYRWLLPHGHAVPLGLQVDSPLDAAQPP